MNTRSVRQRKFDKVLAAGKMGLIFHGRLISKRVGRLELGDWKSSNVSVILTTLCVYGATVLRNFFWNGQIVV